LAWLTGSGAHAKCVVATFECLVLLVLSAL